MEKEMMVKASVDIGDNLVALLDKIAKQIGTTADQVFPWYVKQQVLEGWMFFICDGVAITLSTTLLISFLKKSSWKNMNAYSFLAIVAGCATFLSLFILLLTSPNAVTQIINPNFFALRTLTHDLSRLIK